MRLLTPIQVTPAIRDPPTPRPNPARRIVFNVLSTEITPYCIGQVHNAGKVAECQRDPQALHAIALPRG